MWAVAPLASAIIGLALWRDALAPGVSSPGGIAARGARAGVAVAAGLAPGEEAAWPSGLAHLAVNVSSGGWTVLLLGMGFLGAWVASCAMSWAPVIQMNTARSGPASVAQCPEDRRDSFNHAGTRCPRRNTNRRHLADDHCGADTKSKIPIP